MKEAEVRKPLTKKEIAIFVFIILCAIGVAVWLTWGLLVANGIIQYAPEQITK